MIGGWTMTRCAGSMLALAGLQRADRAKESKHRLACDPEFGGMSRRATKTCTRSSARRLHGGLAAGLLCVPLLACLTPEAAAAASPTVTVSSGPAVTEGTAASFTVTATPAPVSDLTVLLHVDDDADGDFVASGDEGDRQVTIAGGGTGSATVTVATVPDGTDEPSGEVTLSVRADNAYAGTPSSPVAVEDDDATIASLVRTDSGPIYDKAGLDNKLEYTISLGRPLVAGEVAIVSNVIGPLGVYGLQEEDYTVALKGGEIVPGGHVDLPGTGGVVAVRGKGPTAVWLVFHGAGAQTAKMELTAVQDSRVEGSEKVRVTIGLDWQQDAQRSTNVGGGVSRHPTDNEFTTYIRDTDAGPDVSFAPRQNTTMDYYTDEGDSTEATLRLSEALSHPVTIPVEVVSDTATAGTDFPAGPRNVTFPAGATTATLTVPTTEDGLHEDPERFHLSIDPDTLPGGVVPGMPSRVTIIIRDDDEEQRCISGDLGLRAWDNAKNGMYGTPTASHAKALYRALLTLEKHDYEWWAAMDGVPTWPARHGAQPTRTITAQEIRNTRSSDPWSGWDAVIEALEGIETCLAAMQQPDPPASEPEVSIAGSAGVTEGDPAFFTITADPAPAAPLTVTLTVGQSGDYAAAGQTGSKEVVVPVSGSVTLDVATVDDEVDEPEGSVSVTVDAGSGYTVGSAYTKTVSVADDDPAPAANPYAELIEKMVEWRNDPKWVRYKAHTDRWDRALLAFGESVADSSLTPMTAAEAQAFANRGWTRWVEVAKALQEIEGGGQTTTVTPVPELSLSAGNVVNEGGDAEFTITADTAPTADLTVKYTVAQSGDVLDAPGAGNRTATLSAGATTATVAVATDDDATDEPDGSVSVTVDAGKGYTVAASPNDAASVAVSDDDVAPPVNPNAACVSAEVQSDVEGYAAEEHHGPAHVARWKRVLKTFAGDIAQGMTGAEARQMEAKYSANRWQPVAEAIECLEAASQPPPASVPELSLSAGSAVDEGVSATFTIAADTAPQADLTVNFTVAQGGDWLDSPGPGSRTVTLAAGATSITLSLATLDDGTDESDGSVSVTLDAGTDYSVAAGQASGTVALRDNDDASVPVVSISAGSGVTEGAPATFTITANPVPASPLDVTLTVGQSGDFAAAGETGARTVTVPTSGRVTLAVATVDDATDEPDGSVTATLAAGNGHKVAASPDDTASVTVADDDVAAPAGTPTLSVSDATASENGTDCSVYIPCMAFTVTLSQPVDRFVNFAFRTRESTPVSARRGVDFYHAAATDVIFPGETEREIRVYLVEDTRVEDPETFELAVTSATGGVAIGDGVGVGTITGPDPLSTRVPTLSVDDAQAHENDRTVAFTVRLNRASDRAVHFHFGTRASNPVSAQPGVDYWPWSGKYHFPPGETESQIMIDLVNDGHDEDPETFKLWVTNADDGVRIVDGVGVGTILNSDPMPKAWLARFGRTVAEQALDGIAGRMAAPRTAGAHGTLAGRTLRFGNPDGSGAANAPGPLAGLAPPLGGLSGNGTLAQSDVARAFGASADRFGGSHGPGESRTVTAHELLLGSSFTATGEKDGMGGSLALWGRAAQSSFDGREGTFSLDGETTTAMLGADYARNRWLVGFALTQSEGDGGYRDTGVKPGPASQTCPEGMDEALCDGAVREGDGEVEASLTAAVPYAAIQASEHLKLWGAAGHGTGEVTLKPAMGGSLSSDIAWTMAAAGVRNDLVSLSKEGSGLALALTSDALWARTSSEKTHELAASDSDVTRLRLGLEGSWRIATEGDGHLTPKLEIGARHDGGDAETGFGVELGGGIAWVDPALGLSLDLSGRTLVAHGSDDLEDRGFAASLAFDPDPATARGPSLTLTQDWGGAAQGGLDALFASDPLADRTGGGEATARWSAEAAWGLPVFGGAFTGSPHVGLGLATGARDYTLGWRLTPAANANAPDLSLGVRAMRRESDTAAPEHTAGFEAVVRW